MNSSKKVYIREEERVWILGNQIVELTVEKKTGIITNLFFKPFSQELLRGRKGGIIVQDETNEIWYDGPYSPDLSPNISTQSSSDTSSLVLSKENRQGQFFLEETFVIYPQHLLWSAEVKDTSNKPRQIMIRFSLPIVESGWNLWFGEGNRSIKVAKGTEDLRRYRDWDLFLPFMDASPFKEDFGFSVAVPLEDKVILPEFGTHIKYDAQGSFIQQNPYLLLPAKGSRKVRLLVYPHLGDWREGIAWLRKEYATYFEPADKKIWEMDGTWWCTSPNTLTTDNLKIAKKLDVKFVQIHLWYPDFGIYYIDQETWSSEWGEEVGVDALRESIDLCHRFDMKPFIYVDIPECRVSIAEEKFGDSICFDEEGVLIEGWPGTALVIPDPSYSWGKYLLDQVKKILKTYQKVDGIFFDRGDYCTISFGQQDGVTMRNNKPAYQIALGIERFLKAASNFIHSQGKSIILNAASSIGVAQYADALSHDHLLKHGPKLKFLSLNKPTYLMFTDRPWEDKLDMRCDLAHGWETKLKTCALWGFFPSTNPHSIIYDLSYPLEALHLFQAYLPAIKAAAKGTLVLADRALVIQGEGLDGNLFFLDRENYLVSIANFCPGATRRKVKVTVRISEKEVRRATLTSLDFSEKKELEVFQEGEFYHFILPELVSSVFVALTVIPAKGGDR